MSDAAICGSAGAGRGATALALGIVGEAHLFLEVADRKRLLDGELQNRNLAEPSRVRPRPSDPSLCSSRKTYAGGIFCVSQSAPRSERNDGEAVAVRAVRQPTITHPVVHAEQQRLAHLARGRMACFRRVERDKPRPPCERQVRVARSIRLPHRCVARERGGDRNLLRRPIALGERATFGRLDEVTKPECRSEYELRIRRLIATRQGAKGAQARTVAPVAADREVFEPQLSQYVAKLPQRLELRIWRAPVP